jgi:hypothetical protein
MTNWLKRLFGGGSDSSTSEAPEPATAPEPSVVPAEPEPAVTPETPAEGASDTGNEPA